MMIYKKYNQRLESLRYGYKKAKAKGYDILLEYSEEQKCFHFNYIDNNDQLFDEPSPYYMPIGYTDSETYSGFKKTVTMTETLEEMELKYKEYYSRL